MGAHQIDVAVRPITPTPTLFLCLHDYVRGDGLLDLKRQVDESDLEYQIRMCRDKDIHGMSWQEVADVLNVEFDLEFTSSRYRKWWRAFSEGMEYAQSQPITVDDVLHEYEDKRLEMQKERVRLADQRRTLAGIIREQARMEYIRDEVQKSVVELAKHKPLEWSQPTVRDDSNVEGVAPWADWHYGLKADTYFNKYDTDVFYSRLNTLIGKTIAYGHHQGVQTLHVMNLSDAISGGIHVSTRIQSTENVISQTQHVAEAMSEALIKLASEFPTIKFYSTRGNHDRLGGFAKDATISAESFADIIVWYIKARVAHVPNIEIVDNPYDDEIIVANVAGHTLFGIHGDKDRIDQVSSNLSMMLKIIPDAVILGHYHHSVEKEMTGGIDVICSGSLCGTDEYARNIRKTSKPSQKLLVYTDEGRICSYNILL